MEDVKSKLLGYGSENPSLLYGVILLLLLAVLYFALKPAPKPKKTESFQADESDDPEENEEVVDNLISDITKEQE